MISETFNLTVTKLTETEASEAVKCRRKTKLHGIRSEVALQISFPFKKKQANWDHPS